MAKIYSKIMSIFFTACPECGATLEPDGGCMVCRACGWSPCNK